MILKKWGHKNGSTVPKLRNTQANQEDDLRSSTSSRKIGDLTKADHKVLFEGGESRNNHRFAVVVHDFATEWIQSYPCKAKTSQETENSSRKFLEPSQKPKVIYTDNSVVFGKSFE